MPGVGLADRAGARIDLDLLTGLGILQGEDTHVGHLALPAVEQLDRALPEAGGKNVVNVILVDFRGFHALVDALGGVDVDVPRRVLDRVSLTLGGQYSQSTSYIMRRVDGGIGVSF